jgi:predicted nucleic acid-binding protein
VILVDTNVIVDVLNADSEWAGRSLDTLDQLAARDDLAINEIVYAELSAGYSNADELENALATLKLPLARMPREALFLAGQAFRRYRRAAGTKLNVLPDFFIGAHAAVEGASVLTRDPKRIRSYFPTVTLVSPRSA